ncbi:polyhydroxyalkanoate granule-associated phasin [Caballeronia sp. LjRoot31]|uniref:polyhydroxyalkanoate granule-associated phasin n=1 Tax=Caballeronia sp. LjRoot31 TaxID=3342324 RepID=UPI003ECF1CA0
MNTSVLLPSLGELSMNWWRVLMEAGEMFNATNKVVGHRTARMALAGPMPNERDRYEFSLMSREKVEAASESIEALRSGFLNLSLELAMETGRQMSAASAAILALSSSHTAAQWHERQAALLKIATEYPTRPLLLANSTARIVQESLAPIHGRATANAERLGAN